jgi:hypothetical protein
LDALRPSALDASLSHIAGDVDGQDLAPPDASLANAASWVNQAADRMESGMVVSKPELAYVRQLALFGEAHQRENGYWFQINSAILERMGRYDEAEAAWIEASRRVDWDDYQTAFLGQALGTRSYVPAYAYAELVSLRSDKPEALIEDCCRTLLIRAWSRPDRALRLRLATALNGDLMRRHSRSVASMQLGSAISVLALTDPSASSTPTPHPLVVARFRFEDAVAKAKLGYDARSIDKIYREGESAMALAPLDTSRSNTESLSWQSAVVHSAPGSLLACTVLAFGFLALAGIFELVARLNAWRRWFGSILGALVALGVAWMITSIAVALTLSMCILFAGASPKNVRTRMPTWLGPLFSVTTSAVVMALIAAVGGILVVSGPCGRVLLHPLVAPYIDFGFAGPGIVILLISFLFFCSPLWAFAQRLPTSMVVSKALTQAAMKVAIISICAGVAAGPVCVYVERHDAVELQRIFSNEPNLYFTR